MANLRLKMSMSLDGFVAGPNQSEENPLGVGGTRLHEWAFELAAWRAEHGMEGGVVNESTAVVEESRANVGATIMGRKMFGGPAGPWDEVNPWNGWWGVTPPFHHRVFVLTHHPRDHLILEGGTTFTFVDLLGLAMDQALNAAHGKDVMIAGGADTARQFLAMGLVDEMEISLVPIFLGSGERLFESVGLLRGLHLNRTVAAPGVTHYKFTRDLPS